MIRILSRILKEPIPQRERGAALARFFRWQFGSRLLKVPVMYPFVEPTSLIVKNGMHGATPNVYCGLGDFADMGFLLHSLRKEELFLDVGANIGAYSVLASGVCGAQTILFEPSEESAAWAGRNVRINNLSDQVTIRQVAVGASGGFVSFSSMADSPTNRVVLGESKGKPVELIALDSELKGKRPALMKVDVEGFEGEVLKGAQQTLMEPSLYGVIIELTGHGARYGHDEHALEKSFEDLGFVACRYNPFTRELKREEPTDRSKNKLFVRRFAEIQQRVRGAKAFKVCGQEI